MAITRSRDEYFSAIAKMLGFIAAIPLIYWFLPVAVAKNSQNAAQRLSALPGISDDGGWESGIILAIYHLLFLILIALVVTLVLEPPEVGPLA